MGVTSDLAPTAIGLSGPPLTSPVGQYRPELLLLAPEGGEDVNTLSLVAQFLELGVPIELDDNWRLPSEPPQDLSAYKACLFPATARGRYDADLNAVYRAGGYLSTYEYYPTAAQGSEPWAGAPGEKYGRDANAYHVANTMLEGGLTVRDPDFARTLARRSVSSMVAEYRRLFFARHAGKPYERWEKWGDPAITLFMANLILAEHIGDAEWLDLTTHLMSRAAATVDVALTGRYTETAALPETAHLGHAMMGWLLFDRGYTAGNPAFVAAGARLTQHFVDLALVDDGLLHAKYMRRFWGESLLPAPGLYWLARHTGERRYAALADALFRHGAQANARPDGIWHHWSDPRGNSGTTGACWSRGTYWVLLSLVQSLRAVDPAGESAAMLRAESVKILDGLRRHQDKHWGLWHLVLDEPDTRIESTGSYGALYSYDRLRELDAVGSGYDDMFERAFTGLKRLYYAGGVAAACRGTATGVPDYYRTRPLGFYETGLYPATMAPRCDGLG